MVDAPTQTDPRRGPRDGLTFLHAVGPSLESTYSQENSSKNSWKAIEDSAFLPDSPSENVR